MGVIATPARLSQEIVAARQMLERAKERFGLEPISMTADKSYGAGEFLSWLSDRQIAPLYPGVGSETTNEWLLYAA